MWKAAREKNFDAKVFQRSGSGKEKEVNVAMARDITKTLYKDVKEGVDVTFIIVTGDRDLKPPIEDDVLENSIPVEMWSWEKALAREYKQLDNNHPLFQANIIDDTRQVQLDSLYAHKAGQADQPCLCNFMEKQEISC